MYKLVAVGGKLRGQSFNLVEGDNIVGRGSGCDVQTNVEGVSKQHFKITVNDTKCYIQDLGSSNGTFINGKLVKRGTVENKDQIAVPNVIFQLVYVKEKIVRKQSEFKEAKIDYSLENEERMPNDFIGKAKFYFKHRVMSVIYSFNEQYEWNVLLAILLFIFIGLNLLISIGPVLYKSDTAIRSEVKKRAAQYVNEVARYNAIHMSRGEFQKIDTKYLEDYAASEGLVSYELIDMDRRIVRPASKIDTYSNDPVTSKSIDHFKKGRKYNELYYDMPIGSSELGVAKALMVHNNKTGGLEPVGIISMKFRPQSLQNLIVFSSAAYLEALVYSSMIGIIFFGFIYYLTLRPIEQLRKQTISARAKRIKELSSKLLFAEINPVREEINGLLQSLSQFDEDGGGEAMIDEDDHEYVEMLHEISKGLNCATIILNSDKVVQYSNEKAYDLIGIREDFAHDKELIEAIEKDGLADELIRLCDDSSSREGTSVSEEYELAGENYLMFAKAAIGKSRMARAYILTFVRDS